MQGWSLKEGGGWTNAASMRPIKKHQNLSPNFPHQFVDFVLVRPALRRGGN
jgi:hypothetical protein